jgi:hypothetical protein
MISDTGSQSKGSWQVALERFAREHPRGFSFFLMLFTAALAVGLLFAVAPPTVLYQGF